jgi:hypothetical protein
MKLDGPDFWKDDGGLGRVLRLQVPLELGVLALAAVAPGPLRAGDAEGPERRSFEFDTRSQSYDRELQRQRCNFYNATDNLARFENKNIFFKF